ncbi:MAG: transpeptidase family protein [Treponema sp.]|nr:transpeptidase family protein [Treponema sp.]
MNLNRRYIILFIFLGGFALYLLIHYSVLIIKNDITPVYHSASAMTERGAILDRNGRILAMQIRFADVSVWKPSITDIDSLSGELSPIINMSASEIRERINLSASDFLYLKRQVDDTTARRLNAMLDDKDIKKKITGLMVQPVVGRVYPEKNLASQIIGFVGDRNRGLDGIEHAFNSILDGADNDGKGSQIVLTIDINIQLILEQIASRTMNDTGAEAVMFLAMDPRSGDILGSASIPGFDLNNFRDSNEQNRMNRSAIWAYEPGSVFKVFSLAALLESGVISGNTVFNCNGVYTPVRGAPIHCLDVHGNVTAREIILLSCNVGAAKASDNINNRVFHDLLINYGFGSRTGAGSPGETAGFFMPSEQWSDRSKPTLAFGQEISVSGWQMLQAATAIANDGVLVPPRIVSKIISADGKTETEWENGENRRILKAETARTMRSYMMDAATTMGTGWRAGVGDLSLAVKTGTAQMPDNVTRRYSETDYIASCIALLPAESPSLVLYLAIIKPQGEIFGGRIAAPAIREAADTLINYLGIPRGRNPQISQPSVINIPTGSLPALVDKVPDYTGIAKRILLPLLLHETVNVEIYGDGWVRRQSLPPGTPVSDGMTLVLELE